MYFNAMCSVNFGQPYSGFAVSTVIIKPIIFQINFDDIALSSRLHNNLTNFLNFVPNLVITTSGIVLMITYVSDNMETELR